MLIKLIKEKKHIAKEVQETLREDNYNFCFVPETVFYWHEAYFRLESNEVALM